MCSRTVNPDQRSPWPFGHQAPLTRALSLLEVVVVMVVIGTVSAIAVPRYVNFTCKQKVEAAARRIAADLTWAQRLARTKGSAFAVAFNSARQQYYILDVVADAAIAHPDHQDKKYLIDMAKEFDSVTLATASLGGDERVDFDPWGAADSAGVVIVRLGAWQQTISIYQGSGNVSVGTLGISHGVPIGPDPVPVDPDPIPVDPDPIPIDPVIKPIGTEGVQPEAI